MLKEGFSGFENSEQNEYVEGAQKALENFVQLKPEEKVLFLTEPESNRALVDVLSEAVKKIGSVSADLPIDKKTRKNQIEKAALDSDVVFDLTTETEKTMPLYEEDFLENNKYRLVSFADLDKDVFSKDGAD